MVAPRVEKIVLIDVDKLDRPAVCARIEIDESAVAELADSITSRGQLTPIRVQKNGDRYEIVFGDRRHLAFKKLGLTQIKAIVVNSTAKDVLIDRAVENLLRVDLTPLEEARQYYALSNEGALTFGEIGKMTGMSAGSVKRSLKILEMPEYMQRALHQKSISKAVAEELQACPDEDQRKYLVEMAIEHGITKMIARQWVNDYKKSLRVPGVAGEGGTSLEYVPHSEPTYITCYLCKGAVDVMKAKNITVCPGCQKELNNIINTDG